MKLLLTLFLLTMSTTGLSQQRAKNQLTEIYPSSLEDRKNHYRLGSACDLSIYPGIGGDAKLRHDNQIGSALSMGLIVGTRNRCHQISGVLAGYQAGANGHGPVVGFVYKGGLSIKGSVFYANEDTDLLDSRRFSVHIMLIPFIEFDFGFKQDSEDQIKPSFGIGFGI